MKKIMFITTGGTIAGEKKNNNQHYHAGVVNGHNLVCGVEGLYKLANITIRELYSIDSSDMDFDKWRQLAALIEDESLNFDGFIITHGTDTMEETAYFLNLVLKTDKVVVITGAMRANDALSSDGDENLYTSTMVALSDDAKGHGVLVVMNNQIYQGREIMKKHTTSVDAFYSPNSGPIGYVQYGQVKFITKNLKKHTNDTPFSYKELRSAKIQVVYASVGDELVIAENIDALLLITFGNGTLPARFAQKLLNFDKPIVVTTKVHAGTLIGTGTEKHILSGSLYPSKAKILLTLALAKTKDIKEIKAYFDQY